MHRPQWLLRKDRFSGSKVVSDTPPESSPKNDAPGDSTSNCVDRNAVTGDLWDAAYIELRNSNSALVDRFEEILLSEDSATHEVTPREDQLSRIVEAKLVLMKQKEWALRFAGKSVKVRKLVERLVTVVQMTRESLNVVANIDPIHFGLPVAAICSLIPVSPKVSYVLGFGANANVHQLMVNDSQQRTSALEGLSYIADVICRFTEVEKLYLGDKGSKDTKALVIEVVKLYRRVLEFQARAICQFDRSTAHQFARNLVEADGWKQQLEQIKSCEAACEKTRALLQWKQQQQGMELLENTLKLLEVRIQQRGDKLLAELDASREEEKESECLAALRTVEYESDKTRIADRVPGTCEWFLSHDKYQSWLKKTHSRLLWVTADPGCGKSVLSKFLVDSYIESAKVDPASVCYFFFRDGSENNQDGTNALCALLHQLLQQKQTLLRHALPEFKDNKEKLSGLFETLWSIFLKAATDSEAGKIICVLDALDECGERTRRPLLNHIGGFFSNPPASATVKFIITSRPYRAIEDTLWDTYPNAPSVRLMGESEREMSTIQKEISLVIDDKVQRFRERRQHNVIDDDTHKAILKQLARTENRTYLWVSLIFPELDKNVWSSRAKLLQIIKTIPSTVKEAYERILSFSKDPMNARRLLHFVLAAQEPLTLRQMNIALAITENCASAGDLELEPESTFQATVRELCGLFISISDSKIYLIHQTAKEFLLASSPKPIPIQDTKNVWEGSMDLSASHFELAKTCLQYLHLSGFEPKSAIIVGDAASEVSPGGSARPPISNQAFQRRTFHYYSATNWFHHVSRADSEAVDSLLSLMLSITTRGSPAFENWSMQLSNREYQSDVAGGWVSSQTLVAMEQLHIAVVFRIRPLVIMLLKREPQPTEENIVINEIAACAIENCPDIFYLFLNKGLDLGTLGHDKTSLLEIAADCGRIEITRLLVDAGAAVNIENADLREPLYFAVQGRFKALVSLLLEKGARVNQRDKDARTPLYEAISEVPRPRRDFLVVMKEEVENSAEYEVRDNSGLTPLSLGAQHGRLPIAELLIKHGAEIEIRDCKGRTPLSYVTDVYRASAEQMSLIYLLIEHGAQVDSRDVNGRTHLSHAAERWNPDDTAVVDILIQKGAHVETRCHKMRTPLSYAANNCSVSRLRYLIENGAAVNSSDWKGNTPLMYAARGRVYFHKGVTDNIIRVRDTIKILLEKGANPKSVNQYGDSPFLTLNRLNPASFDPREVEAVKEEIKSLLRRYGAGEPKLPTSSDTLSQVVAQMTVNLIGFVIDAVDIELRERQIAAKFSAQLFCGWHLHPTVSNITLHRNTTIQQEITKFVIGQTGKREQGISNPEESPKKHPGPDPRPSITPPPEESPQSQTPEIELQVSEKADEYAGLAPSRRSKNCSYYLHCVAELQQRLFNVNRCLYYLDDHPNDSSETIDDLILKATGQEQPQRSGRCRTFALSPAAILAGSV